MGLSSIWSLIIRSGLLATLSVSLSGCSDGTDEQLWPWTAKSELKRAIGFSPSEAKLLYSWRNCCRWSDPFGGESPGSICVVYQLGNTDFQKVVSQTYSRISPDQNCWPRNWGKMPVKGCSGFSASQFFPEDLQTTLHSDSCSSNNGQNMRIDRTKRVVLIERYFGD